MVKQTARKSTGGKAPLRAQPAPTSKLTVRKSTGNSLKWFGSKKRRAAKKSTRTRHKPQICTREGPFRFLNLPPELRNRIYGFSFTQTPRYGGLGKLVVLAPSPWSVISNSNDWEGSNRSILAILQTSRQVYDEARDLPYTHNFIRFDRFEDLGEFVGHATNRQLSAIQHIQMELRFVDYDTHNWGMLKFFPNLSSLRLVDVDFRSHAFLADPHHPVAVKVSALRGLKELEVVLPYLGDMDIDEEEDQEDANTTRLGAVWKALVTQPKLSAE